jgi:adenylate cyclase
MKKREGAGENGEINASYCLIGNTVNVAARIQGLTRNVGCDILISEETVKQLSVSPKMEQQPPRRVKGYSKPITVYRLL